MKEYRPQHAVEKAVIFITKHRRRLPVVWRQNAFVCATSLFSKEQSNARTILHG
jgi:hypothetical protein